MRRRQAFWRRLLARVTRCLSASIRHAGAGRHPRRRLGYRLEALLPTDAPQKPVHIRELTPRAVAVGLVVAVLMLLEVPGAALIGWVWLGQVPRLDQVPGLALLVLGVGVVVLGAARSPAAPRLAPAEEL